MQSAKPTILQTLTYTISSKQNPTQLDFICVVCCHENLWYDPCPYYSSVTPSEVATVSQATRYMVVLHHQLK